MKGCALSCLTGLLTYAAAFVLIFVALTRAGVRQADALGAAMVVGFLATMSISFIWTAWTMGSQGRLIRKAIKGVPPVDGKWAGFAGVIQSRAPIISPISGREAVAFAYNAWRSEHTAHNINHVSYFVGTALAPSTISTNLGTYKLLAVPMFELAKTEASKETATSNMAAYIERTEFESKPGVSVGRHMGEEGSTDEYGAFRHDVKYGTAPELSELTFDEQLIEQGESVCVIGLYSQAKGAIVTDPSWAKRTRIVRGDGEVGVRAIETRSRRYVMIGLAIGAVAVAILWNAASAVVVPS